LFEPGQLALEFIDIGRGTEPGGVPGLLAEQLRQPGLQLPDPGGQAVIAVQRVGQVG
jgi:hypothetical protein